MRAHHGNGTAHPGCIFVEHKIKRSTCGPGVVKQAAKLIKNCITATFMGKLAPTGWLADWPMWRWPGGGAFPLFNFLNV